MDFILEMEKTLINSNPSADWRPRPRPKNMELDQVNSEKSIEDRSDSGNVSTKNRFYQNDQVLLESNLVQRSSWSRLASWLNMDCGS